MEKLRAAAAVFGSQNAERDADRRAQFARLAAMNSVGLNKAKAHTLVAK